MARTFKRTTKESELLTNQARVRAEFIYDPLTGAFIRFHKFHGVSKLGPVGYRNREGYIVIACNGASFLAHRLAWLYAYGEWPPGDIDHKNNIRDDNRLENLRLATRSQNMRNVGVLRSNTSGYRGVSLYKPNGKWRARVYLNDTCHYLGYYERKEDAANACSEFVKSNFEEFMFQGGF